MLSIFNPPPSRKGVRLVVNEPRGPRRPPALREPSPWDQLTARLVMDRARAGTLNPAIVEALLVGVGLRT